MGRGPRWSKMVQKRKEEKADKVLPKEGLKSSEIVKPPGLRRSSRSQQVSPVVTDDQDQESLEIRRKSKRGSNILPEHFDGESLSIPERAVFDDQREVKQVEKKRENGKSIKDSLCHEAEDDGVHENSKVEKKLQRKKHISIEDTPTPYKKVKSKTAENLPKEKAAILKEKVPETQDVISRQESTKTKKASPIPKKLRGSEARKEEVGKVRKEHENGGIENEAVRESSLVLDERGSSLIREGRGARKKKSDDVVAELSSPQKKPRGGRRRKNQDELEETLSQELSSVTKENGEMFKVQPQESVKLSKQNLRGSKHGKESGVLESSMLTKLAERKRRSEAMSAADWEETLERFEIFCLC